MTQANKANILTGHVGDHKANRPIRGIRIVHELIEKGTASPRGLLVCSGLLQRSMLRGQLFPLVGGAGMRRAAFSYIDGCSRAREHTKSLGVSV